MPISLWKYRCGDYAGALAWSQRGLAQKGKFSACDVDLHLIMAMAEYQLGDASEADAELGQQRDLVEAKFRAGLDRGRSDAGYWFDWYFANRLLREATALIEGSSPPMETVSHVIKCMHSDSEINNQFEISIMKTRQAGKSVE